MQLITINAPVLSLREMRYCLQLWPVLLEVASGELTWPKEVTDELFAPPRNFEKRQRARRFLKWLVSLGVQAQPWLDQLEAPKGKTAPPGKRLAPPTPFEGYVGRAYPVGKHIVKFTTDSNEARVAAALVGRELSMVANVLDAKKVPIAVGSGKSLFAIVQEKVNVGVGKKFRVAGGAAYDYLDHTGNPFGGNPFGSKSGPQSTLSTALQGAIPYLPSKYQQDRATIHALKQVLRSLRDLYAETGIEYYDPHGANLALKNRRVGFFDFGRAQHTRASPVVGALK